MVIKLLKIKKSFLITITLLLINTSYTFGQCPAITLTGTTYNAETCVGCNDASITAGVPSGGVAPYEYSLDGQIWTTSNTFTNLSQGYFVVYARDSNGCIGKEKVTNYLNIAAGACVIDMGITPQTVNNGLAPYGLVYDLVVNHKVPVYWIINPNKTYVNAKNIVNQTDVTVTGTTTRLGTTAITANLKAGPFLIPANYVATAAPIIEQWQTNRPGLTVHWNLNAIPNAPVYGVIRSFANSVIYPKNNNVNLVTPIEKAFYIPAGIPNTTYRRGFISDINSCDELYILAHHTDPDLNWSQQDIDDIYNYVINGGNVWMGCHDVSMTESTLTTTGGQHLNFLSKTGLLPYKTLNNISTTYPHLTPYANASDQIPLHVNSFNPNKILYNLSSASNQYMQFMRRIQRSLNGNSERVYLPFKGNGGGWRNTTTIAMYDPTNIDVLSGRSDGKAALIAYGPAYGNTMYGNVLYEASHIHKANGGTVAQSVGERRVFGNFLIESAMNYAKDAGADKIFTSQECGVKSVTLDANKPINKPGVWSVLSGIGGTFEDVTNPKSKFYGQKNQTYVLQWTVDCSADTMKVTFVSDCTNLDFDGVDDNISFGDNYDFNGSFSIEVWLKSNVTNANTQTIVSKRKGDTSDTGYDLRLVNNMLSFNWNTSGSLTSAYPIQTNKWHHVAVTFNKNVGNNNGTYTMYIDGVNVGSTVGTLPATATNTVQFIAGAMDQTVTYPFKPINYFNGWLDELRIWNVALTPTQIRSMMNQEIQNDLGNVKGSTIPLQIQNLTWNNLVGYYQMNQASDIVNGSIVPKSGIAQGELRNINTAQPETAPLPYYTVQNGDWDDTTATTPWMYGNSVWNIPNTTGIDGVTKIDWNIAVINKHNIQVNRDLKLLGLISYSNALVTDEEILDSKLIVGASGGSHELNISKYLKLDGKIDLQNESQLIQGQGSVLDVTSKGYVERDQQGTENSYTYNYWSSPVSKRNITVNNLAFTVPDVLRDGTATATPGAIDFGYNYTYADGALTSPRKISTYWIWKFLNSGDDYSNWQWVGDVNSLNVADGYTMKGTSGTSPITNEQNYVFRGKPNNGTITHTTFPGVFDATGKPFVTLTGNPYASALDADAFINDNLNGVGGTNSITGTLYFWEHWSNNTHVLQDYQGGYALYTKAGGTQATSHPDINQGGTGNKPAPGRYIPIGQGFFVTQAHDVDALGNLINPSSGNVVFKNSQRVFQIEQGNVESSFTRTANNTKGKSSSTNGIVNENKQRIWLGFNSPNGFHRQVLAAFLAGATDGIDRGYDGKMIDVLPNDAYFVQENKPYSIVAYGEFNIDREIPMTIVVDQNNGGGIQKIMIDRIENIGSEIPIYIKDNLTNTYFDLRNGVFEISLTPGTYESRFSLTFRSQVLAVEDDLEVIKDGINIYMDNSTSEIQIKNRGTAVINKTILYNSLGQAINSWKHKDLQAEINLPVQNLSTGMYIVQIDTDKGSISKKIVIK